MVEVERGQAEGAGVEQASPSEVCECPTKSTNDLFSTLVRENEKIWRPLLGSRLAWRGADMPWYPMTWMFVRSGRLVAYLNWQPNEAGSGYIYSLTVGVHPTMSRTYIRKGPNLPPAQLKDGIKSWAESKVDAFEQELQTLRSGEREHK